MPTQTIIDHAQHDPALIAGHASGELAQADRATADTLIATCRSCADLRRDLVAIAAATRSLPAPAVRRRDFSIAPEQAERLVRGSWLRALLRPFAAPRSAVRPMAAAFTSLGLAGLLVAVAIPGMFLGSAGAPSAANPEFSQVSASHAPEPASAGKGQDQDGNVVGAPEASDVRALQGNENPPDAKNGEATDSLIAAAGGNASPAADDGDRQASRTEATINPSPNLLVIASLALLAAGLVLFGLGFAARRVR